MKNVLACAGLVGLAFNLHRCGGSDTPGKPKVINFEDDVGGVADKNDFTTWFHNQKVLNKALTSLKPGDRLVIPNRTFYVVGGIRVDNLKSVTIQIDGTLTFTSNTTVWPHHKKSHGGPTVDKRTVNDCWFGENWEDVTITSSGIGTLDGNGKAWWDQYFTYGENRPMLMGTSNGKGLLFENIFFKNSPYWTFYMEDVDGLEVRNCRIDARYDQDDGHSSQDITAFNTDGFDVTGRNVWIHDSYIWNQDDCIAVKGGKRGISENMLFERLEASGLGLTIGSISHGHTVRNITFRDVHMHKTYKGIYVKIHDGNANIEDITYENIFMDGVGTPDSGPGQYPIWIGPAQQSDSGDFCHPNPCSLCWPQNPGAQCNVPPNGAYKNIVLRNVTVNSSVQSPGVILGGNNTPMTGIVFEDVKFMGSIGTDPFGKSFYCANVQNGIANGSTWPIPPCFNKDTSAQTLLV